MKRVSFHLTDNEIRALRDVREKTGYSQAELIRKAVDLLLSSWVEKPGVTGIINTYRLFQQTSMEEVN